MDFVIDRTSSKMINFNEQMAILLKSMTQCAIWTIIELEEDIMVLNNVTKFHKILIKTNNSNLESEHHWCDVRTDIRTDRIYT